jgi:hypothetical protein
MEHDPVIGHPSITIYPNARRRLTFKGAIADRSRLVCDEIFGDQMEEIDAEHLAPNLETPT